MLSFYPPALRRDAARHGPKSLAFDLGVLVLTAVLIAASMWFVVGNASTAGNASREEAWKQSSGHAKWQAPFHPGPA